MESFPLRMLSCHQVLCESFHIVKSLDTYQWDFFSMDSFIQWNNFLNESFQFLFSVIYFVNNFLSYKKGRQNFFKIYLIFTGEVCKSPRSPTNNILRNSLCKFRGLRKLNNEISCPSYFLHALSRFTVPLRYYNSGGKNYWRISWQNDCSFLQFHHRPLSKKLTVATAAVDKTLLLYVTAFLFTSME